MNRDRKTRNLHAFVSGAALVTALGLAAAAHAQVASPQPAPAAPATPVAEGNGAAAESDSTQSKDIVVTGTLIRGVAPIGTNLTIYSKEDLERTGQGSTQAILAQLPMVTSAFNSTGATNTNTALATRPTLRANLAASGANTTLVLIDGHNAVGAGLLATTPDSGVIPPAALERIDIMADGGSSLYGSDAVGEIINFVTRRSFDGIQVEDHFTFNDGHHVNDLSIIGGQKWSSGGFLLAYTNRWDSGMYNKDRPLPRQDVRAYLGDSNPLFDNRAKTCYPGNVTAAGVIYRLPSRTAGTAAADTINECDPTIFSTATPRERQNSVFISGYQDLTDSLTVDIKGYYTDRRDRADAGPFTLTNDINTNNPNFRPIGAETTQTVATDLSPIYGLHNYSTNNQKNWGVTPILTYKFLDDWQAKLLLNYGHSNVSTLGGLQPDPALLAAATTGPGQTAATSINLYDVSTTPKTIFDSIYHSRENTLGVQNLYDARLTFDGSLFELPGGTVRAAFGAEHQRQTYYQRDTVAYGTSATPVDARRTLDSAFAQLVVPIIGGDFSIPLVKALIVDASVRYDHYNDFGSTTNPKFGVSWTVFDGLKLRGNYGTSFNAPSLADSYSPVEVQIGPLGANECLFFYTAPINTYRYCPVIAGGNVNLKPMTARTYSLGGDFSPKFIPGLSLGATYWNIKYKNQIGFAPFFNQTSLFANPAYAPYYIVATATTPLTLPQILAFAGGIRLTGFPVTNLTDLFNLAPNAIGGVFDARRVNLGSTYTSGWDFNARYNHETGWGRIFASLNGTLTTKNKTQAVANTPFVDNLRKTAPSFSTLSMSGTLGATYRRLTASATMNYSRGYLVLDGTGNTTLYKIGSYHPVNMAFQYRIDGGGLTQDLELMLNIDNAFNQVPPIVGRSAQNGSSLGRQFNIGLRKKF